MEFTLNALVKVTGENFVSQFLYHKYNKKTEVGTQSTV